jgi:DNA polymerase III epsilon subunit-like protein
MWKPIDSFVSFDFEVTGLDPGIDRIIQVGVCVVRNGVIHHGDEWLVNQPVEVSEGAFKCHGISTDMCREKGRDPKESVKELLKYFSDEQVKIGHNIHNFDCQFLLAECERLGISPPPDTSDFIDTAATFKGWRLGLRRQRDETREKYAIRVLSQRVRGLKFSVDACLEYLGLPKFEGKRHSARADSEALVPIFIELQRRIHESIKA